MALGEGYLEVVHGVGVELALFYFHLIEALEELVDLIGENFVVIIVVDEGYENLFSAINYRFLFGIAVVHALF